MDDDKVLERVKGWAKMILILTAGALSLGAYAHNTFRTNREADKFEGDTKTRLIRIEDKIDRIAEKGPARDNH